MDTHQRVITMNDYVRDEASANDEQEQQVNNQPYRFVTQSSDTLCRTEQEDSMNQAGKRRTFESKNIFYTLCTSKYFHIVQVFSVYKTLLK